MFKLVEERRAWWPVTWNGVTEEGEVVENRIEMRFIVQGEDEFFALFDEARNLGETHDAANAAVLGRLTAAASEQPAAPAEPPRMSRLYAEFVHKIATDWRGVAAENEEPLKWSEDNLRLLMNVPGVFQATLRALGECRKGARPGN